MGSARAYSHSLPHSVNSTGLAFLQIPQIFRTFWKATGLFYHCFVDESHYLEIVTLPKVTHGTGPGSRGIKAVSRGWISSSTAEKGVCPELSFLKAAALSIDTSQGARALAGSCPLLPCLALPKLLARASPSL